MKLPEVIINILSYTFVAFIYLFLFMIFRSYIKSIKSSPTENEYDDSGKTLCLTVQSNTSPQKLLKIYIREELHIGRSTNCDIILDDEYVSSNHAVIKLINKDQLAIEDLQSTNGTFIGDNMIEERTVLKPGMEIKIGKSAIRLDSIR